MGAWGHEFNANDDAADWLGEFADGLDWASVDAALNAVLPTGEYIEAPECSAAIAGAEVVAAGLGKASPLLDGAIAHWALVHAAGASARRDLAKRAVLSVSSESELLDLWSESDDSEYNKDWLATLNDLLSRLG